MKKIEALLSITTPMFIAGSDQQQAEFRIPSLLGALRFWYRATASGKLTRDIPALRKAEASLFGSTDAGQAEFIVRADSSQISITDAANTGYGLSYLGYGAINVKPMPRNYICIRKEFSIKLSFIFRPQVKNPDTEGLKRALTALSLFGGLGSRSRRGFGSVALVSLKDEEGKEHWHSPQTREELRAAIQAFISSIGSKNITGLSEYTAFTSSTRIILSQTNRDAIDLLNCIGQEMIRYRSYGSNKNGIHYLPWDKKEAEQNFADDHDLLLSLRQNPNPGKHPRRVAFGLPHNYFFGSTKQSVGVAGEKSERRASPLFIHIHQLEKEYAAVLTYLPAKFLPDGESINIKMKINRPTIAVPCNFDGQVITDFLDRIPDAMEVI